MGLIRNNYKSENVKDWSKGLDKNTMILIFILLTLALILYNIL